MIVAKRMVRTKIRAIIFLLLLAPYAVSMIGVFSSYLTFFHRTSFQLAVSASGDNNLELFVFSSAEFAETRWTDGKKEFEREGKMFDVARIEQKGNVYFVYCENDSLEDLLISYLKTAGSKSKSGPIAQAQFFEPVREFVCHNFSLRLSKPDYFTINLYVSVPDELITPPPRVS